MMGPRMSFDRAQQGWLEGKLLLASDLLRHSFFDRTVIGIIEHTDDGTVGFILNRPSLVAVDEVLGRLLGPGEDGSPVYIGGPVQYENAIGVAATDGDSVSGVDIVDVSELWATDTGMVRVYAGYAGWDAGQVEWEIGMESWLVVEATIDDFFTDSPDSLYERVATRCGYEASDGPDPLLN